MLGQVETKESRHPPPRACAALAEEPRARAERLISDEVLMTLLPQANRGRPRNDACEGLACLFVFPFHRLMRRFAIKIEAFFGGPGLGRKQSRIEQQLVAPRLSQSIAGSHLGWFDA